MQTLEDAIYDLACRHCWKPGQSTISEAEEADDSGSSGSLGEQVDGT